MKKKLLFLIFISISTFGNAQVCSVFISSNVMGDSVQYYGSSPDNPALWSWYFSGGTPITSTLQNPIVHYSAPGTYTTALSIQGGINNCSSSLSIAEDSVTIITTSIKSMPLKNDFSLRCENEFILMRIFPLINQHVEISLFDSKGSCAGSIFQGLLIAGENNIQSHYAGIVPGIYTVDVKADDMHLTKKAILD